MAEAPVCGAYAKASLEIQLTLGISADLTLVALANVICPLIAVEQAVSFESSGTFSPSLSVCLSELVIQGGKRKKKIEHTKRLQGNHTFSSCALVAH